MAVYKDGILYVDNSTLCSFSMCELQATIRYGLNLKPDSGDNAPAKAGTAIHAAIEAHYLGASKEEALQHLHEQYYDYALLNIDASDRLGYDNVRAVADSWITRYPLSELPYVPSKDHIEVPFRLPLLDDGSIVYVGRIDALVQSHNGRTWYVLDTKSTGRLDEKFKKGFNLAPQFSGYIWAAQQLWNLPVDSFFVNAVDVSLVPGSTRQCGTHRTKYNQCGYLHLKHQLIGPIKRLPEQIDDWLYSARQQALKWKKQLDKVAKYGDGVIALTPATGEFTYQACALCDYHKFCCTGRNLKNSNFVYEEWIPSDLAEDTK